MVCNRNWDSTRRFLIRSFSAIIIFSIVAFGWLSNFMTRKSHNAFHQIGDIYMTGISDQIANHFESVIQLRFDQVNGLVSVVSSESLAQENMYEELSYQARIRDFDYLAICATDGSFETLYGEPIQPKNPGPFLDALMQGEERVAIGMDASGNEVVLFSVSVNYPLWDGDTSIAVIAAVPLNYITDFLSLEDDSQTISYCIVRNDGSFVIKNPGIDVEDSSGVLPELLHAYKGSAGAEYSAEDFSAALMADQTYSSVIVLNGEECKIHSTPLSNSEWNLVSIMPYNQISDVMETLNVQRTKATVVSCLSVLILMILVFVGFFRMTNTQMDELEVSQRRAAEASKAKSEFLANMSHDIRTPMNAIMGMTAIATTRINDTEQVKSCLKKIALSSKQLLGLINDILDMSKIESGKMTVREENTSLKDLFEGIVSIMQPQIKMKKQHFDVHVEGVTTENVWCDGGRLNQVLLNLLSNATKYTQEGGEIKLSLSEEKSPKGEGYARIHIVVEDNGMGMTPEFLAKIFEAYSRADNTRTQKIEGTGLGMAITKYIVDAMEGTINVQSELDKGSKFYLTFDFKKAHAMETNMVLPPWNMLVVDDDEFLCKSTISTLEQIGIKGEWTLSGEQAIAMAIERHQRGEDYQIILLDWKLPGMNGIQVAKELRHYLGDDVPILLISAYDWSEFETEAREAGINGFIPKPLFKSTLIHSLSRYMDAGENDSQEQEQLSKFSGKRVLLAEDNELNWEVAQELLSDLELELDWAEDGRLCLEKFEASPVGHYDLILMDIRMPNMTGYESTRAIRGLNRPDARTIPIIAMSADAFQEDVKRCLECGMNDHTAKPIDIGEVTKLLEKYLH